MGDTFFHINWIDMGRRSRRLRATTLVDRDIDEYTALFHFSQHRARDQFWRFRPWQKHRPDQKITIGDEIGQICFVRILSADIVHHEIEKPQALDVDIENGDVCFESARHAKRIYPGGAAAEHNNPARQNSGNTTEQYAAAAK